jgi:transcriptional regulator with XRE-family HTH domain
MTIKQVFDIYETSQNQVAKKLGINPCNFRNWSIGRDKIPARRLKQLAELFEVDEEFFIRDLSKLEQIYLKLKFVKRKYGIKSEEFQQLMKEGAFID